MEAIEKFNAITTGFGNIVFSSKETEKKALERATICSNCQHAEQTLLTAILPDKKKASVSGMKCGICKCFLPAKVRQDIQRCPIQKW